MNENKPEPSLPAPNHADVAGVLDDLLNAIASQVARELLDRIDDEDDDDVEH